MTIKQQKEIDLLKWFIRDNLKHINITDKDIEKYFKWSETGKYKDEIKMSHFDDGFNLLVACKQNRELQMQIWEDGIETVPYFTILGGWAGIEKRSIFNPMRYIDNKYRLYHIPLRRDVVDFMKKGMFKGMDAEQIEKLYNDITR